MSTVKQVPVNLPNNYTRFGTVVRNGPSVLPGFTAGTSLPGWKKVIASGLNATTPLLVDRFTLLDAKPLDVKIDVNLHITPTWIIDTAKRPIDGYPSDLGSGDFGHLVSSVPPEAEAQALTRILSKIRQESYGANGMLFLGELSETIRMLRNPLNAAQQMVSKYVNTLETTRDYVRKHYRRRPREARRTFRERRMNAVKNGMSGSWLELQFGMIPLVSDVKDILGTALELASGRYNRKRLQSRSAEFKYANESYSTNPVQTCILHDSRKTSVTTANVQYVCGMNSELAAPTSLMEEARKRMGFSFQNFVPTIYELIPWSFLIDYFVNLGDIIEAACTDTSSVAWISKTVRLSTETLFRDVIRVYDESGMPGFRAVMTGQPAATRKVRNLTLSRTRPSSFGLPPLIFSIPGMDSKKWINMGALLAQARDFRFH